MHIFIQKQIYDQIFLMFKVEETSVNPQILIYNVYYVSIIRFVSVSKLLTGNVPHSYFSL